MADDTKDTTSQDTKDDKTPLTKAVEKAVEDNTKEEETTEEETTEEDSEETEEESDEFTDEHLQRAKQLYRALSNPSTARQVVEILAQNAGLIKTGSEKEEVKAVKSVTEMIQEGLGDDYKFLGAKLSKLIPDVIERMVEEKVSGIRESQTNREKKETSQEFHTAFADLREEFDDFDTFHNDMNRLMDIIPVNDKLSAKEYFRNLYLLAKGQKGSKVKNTVKVDKTRLQKSKDNVAARLATGGEAKDVAKSSSGQKMTLRESIQAAVDSLANKDT